MTTQQWIKIVAPVVWLSLLMIISSGCSSMPENKKAEATSEQIEKRQEVLKEVKRTSKQPTPESVKQSK